MSEINIVVDATSATIKLREIEPKARAGVKTVVARNTIKLWNIVRQKVSGDVLNVQSGALRRSIQQDVADVADGTTGRVYSDSSVKYARIQEYGGKVSIPEIVPVNAKALAFEYQGKLIFVKRVRAHDVTIPAHPYMRPSLAEIEPTFQADMRAVAAEAAA